VLRLTDLTYRASDALRWFLRLAALLSPGRVRLALAPNRGGEVHLVCQLGAHILERSLARLRVVVRVVCVLLDMMQQRRKDPVERVTRHSLHNSPHH
jgi:hypothetical protein